MSRVIHFDLSADEPERAVEFYRNVFDWDVDQWQGPADYWMIQTGSKDAPGITGGIAKRIQPGDTTVVIFDVESVDEAVEKVLAAGGSVREAKRAIPGVGYLSTCRDTEGNTFGVMQLDQTAA
jgi:predicted enzyme related to lactoylglutathione lyase